MTGGKFKANHQRSPSAQAIASLTALFQSGHLDDAKSAAQALTAKFPKHGFAWKVLGVIHQSQGNDAESLLATQNALALLPGDASVHNNLATAFLGLGRTEEAEACIRKALAIAPDYVKALSNYGTLLRRQEKHAQAEVYFRRALEAAPENAIAHIRLGNSLELQNKLHSAHESYRAALTIAPAMKFVHSDLLHLMSLDAAIGPEQLFAEHRAFGEQLEALVSAKCLPHQNTKDASRKLKLGFITADLYNHALANYFEPLFGHLIDKPELSVFIYYNNTQSDMVTNRLRDFLPNWYAVSELSDDELAAKIRDDGIDILVDLNGHTVLNRLPVFAQKPAPVQVSWLGYLGTTGLRTMDYYVADAYWLPPEKMHWQFTEKLAYLPAVVAFEPNHHSPPVNPLPALSNGYITFGNFNRHHKINPPIVRLWSTLLKKFPESKMVLGAIPPEHQDSVAKLFECEGVSQTRLTFFGRVAQTAYLALHHKVDFCLDTFPFGGGATTAHAAWMGVPTLSLAGETPASRFGATEMHHLNLDSFVSRNEDEFIAKSTYWVENIEELADIRHNLRARFLASPLGQYQKFADNFAAMLRTMWLRWCADALPTVLTADEIASHVVVSQPVVSADPPVKELRALDLVFGNMEYGKAELLARELIKKYPDHGLARKILGSTLRQLGRLNEALATHQATVDARPDDYEAHFNLAVEYQQQGMLDEAVKSYIHAIGLRPHDPNAYNNIGNIFKTMGLFPQAELYCRQALTFNPEMAQAHNNLGNALHAQGRYTESIASYQQALALKPDWADAYNNLAIVLKDQGHSNEAQKTYQKALQLKPDWAAAHSNFLYCLSLDVHTTPDQLHAEHLAFGQKFEHDLRTARQAHTNVMAPDRTIHIGFVSGDFYDHALANFFEPAFEFLAKKSDLVLHAYYNHIYDDAVTKRMRSNFAHWHCVAELTDDDLASSIRADGIDILFDLSGHTAHNRLLTFARKPAPIQVSWLGYLGTSGLEAMDYYLCDKFWIPPGELDWQLCEKPAYMPSAVTFKPSIHAPVVNALPALVNGHITFGSFNRTNKLNPSVVVLWAMLLRDTPTAKMVFGGIPTESQLELFHRFADEGINPDRLTFFPRANLQEYLALHHQVDFCLDTFPYGGGATTAHAAWMGVPSLSLAGESPASRFGASTMHHLGLDDFIATSIEDYLAKGRYWSEHISELAAVRQSLRDRFSQSSLGQHAAFADNLHDMLRTMWARRCNDLPPVMLEVNAQSASDDCQLQVALSQPPEEMLQALLDAYQASQHEQAEHLANALIEQFPEHALAWRIFGYIRIAQSRYQDALAPLRRSLVIEPTDPATHLNLGLALADLAELPAAESHLRQAVELSPNYGKAYVNLGMVLRLQGKFEESESACHRALEIDPCDASAHIQLGNALESLGHLSEAQASYYRADMAHEPRKAVAHSNVLYLLNHDVLVEPKHLFTEHLAFGEQFEAPLRTGWKEHRNSKDLNRKLNVGFVSGDFHHHALNAFLEPAFKALAKRDGITMSAYSNGPCVDVVTQRMRNYFVHWRDVRHLTDEALTRSIRQDGIDILIDLSGHTANNRLLTFARKPAPIQISWLGYLGTTGLTSMDYYLCDAYWIPPVELDWQFTEKMAYLPNAVVFEPDSQAPPVSTLPALCNGYFTFGSFNRVSKINNAVIALWAMVMQKAPDSRLVLAGIEEPDQPAIAAQFAEHDIAATRLTFYPRLATADYLALHQQVDIALDTFPHGGGATTAHAAWMGVPCLSLAGESPASRFGAILMHHIGLDGFIATSIEEYVSKSQYWYSTLNELAALRQTMRTRIENSPLRHLSSFADHFEVLLRTLWQGRCALSTTSPACSPFDATGKATAHLHLNEVNVVASCPPSILKKIQIISATKLSEEDFWKTSALGRSLMPQIVLNPCITVRVTFNNSDGLPELFNAAIDQADDDAILVFIHDDVWIDETDLTNSVIDGLSAFDIIGVAGNRRRLPHQPAWAFIDTLWTWDEKANLSGRVGCGRDAFGPISDYGPSSVECELLDGLFLATSKRYLGQSVRFDTKFDFHFYDMDFCRSARTHNLKLGTWPIQLTHQSAGAFGSQDWFENYQKYLEKWEICNTSSTSAPRVDAFKTTQFDLHDSVNVALTAADECSNKNDLETAKLLLLEILKVQPRNAKANVQLGKIEIHKNSPEPALLRFEIAVNEEPMHESHWVHFIEALSVCRSPDIVADALELGQQFGLSNVTARQISTDLLKKMEMQRAILAILEWRPETHTRLSNTGASTQAPGDPVCYVWAFPYTELSSGIKALHILCDLLNRLGFECFVTTTKTNPNLNTPVLTDDLIETHRKQGRLQIAIYPEVEIGNPLKAPNVIRYLLNQPNFFLKTSWFGNFHTKEKVIHFDNTFSLPWIKSDLVFLPTVDRQTYYSKNDTQLKRKGYLVYSHRVKPDLSRIPASFHPIQVISMANPKSAIELADLYRSSLGLILFERTAAGIEAMLCGCPVICCPSEKLARYSLRYPGYDDIAWDFDAATIDKIEKSVHTFEAIYDANFESDAANLSKVMTRLISEFRINPITKEDVSETPAVALSNAARLFECGRIKEAIFIHQKLTQTAPEYIENYFKMGQALISLGLRDQGLKILLTGAELLNGLPAHPSIQAVRQLFAEHITTSPDEHL